MVHCVQAILLCTKTRAKKVIVWLILIAVLIGYAVSEYRHRHGYRSRYYIIYVIYFALREVLLVTVLIINVLLVRDVRRASINAAANLGLQQHHQSTSSSNSAVPTVMVVAISLVYVLLRGPESVVALIRVFLTPGSFFRHCSRIAVALGYLAFAYNFYVYLITGQQFRSELRTLISRCFSFFSFSSSPATATAPVARDCSDASLARRGQAETAV